MRKLCLLLIAIMSAFAVLSQTTKGKIFVSGGTGLQFISSNVKYVYDGETYETDKTSQISIVPSFAYFIQDNLAVGLTSMININTTKLENGNKTVSSLTTLLPTAIYYFPLEGKIRPVAQVGIGLSSQTDKYIPKTGSDQKESYSGLAFNLGGGLAYFIKENISVNFGLSYTKINQTNGDDNKEKIKQGNFGSNIGLSIYF